MNAEELARRLDPLLRAIYPDDHDKVTRRLVELAAGYADRLASRRIEPLTEASACLITYADAVRRPGETPLHTLDEVLRRTVGHAISGVHLLPMYPWTSDDGFAVVDHREINPAVGTWADVSDLCGDYAVMFDFVANHVSSRSTWFQGYLGSDPRFADFFIERDPDFDTSRVVRPRTTPLFHRFPRLQGPPAEVWTTFGPDQVDVNVAAPATLLELTDVLLGYVARGAAAIRLDAIGFLWKHSGTSCIHLPQTHAIIKVWRALVDHLAPGVQLVTETNVPHVENVSYFGDGNDEAHQVYQFALPPLVLHSFVSRSTRALTAWARGIGPVSPTATWFNFLASHDGIGLRPTEGILDEAQRQALVARAFEHGGRVSMAVRPDGSQTVYELNVNYLDALCAPDEVGSPSTVAAKALAAHSVLLAFVGVPAIYYHSLFGSRSDVDGMEVTGINRRINREGLDADRLLVELERDERRRLVFSGMSRLLEVRRTSPAFSPYGPQRVEAWDDRVFVLRRAEGTDEELVCVTNVTAETVTLDRLRGLDLVTGTTVSPLVLGPYAYAWVRPEPR